MTTEMTNYETLLTDARKLLEEHPSTRALLDPTLPVTVLERFLIEWSSLAVQMTEPVESWIKRAGARCTEVGLTELGRQLGQHAKHEAGHHLMLIEDTKKLVERWNAKHTPRLSANELIARPATPAMREYIDLHEQTIVSDAPFGQVAIEYEIEQLSVVFAAPLLKHCRERLDPSILEGTSFLAEHVELDVGHTALNRKMLGRLLTARPEALESVARTGARALVAYVTFFDECLKAARAAVAQSENVARV